MLARHGVRLDGLGLDTMLASYLLDATRSGHPLEDVALEYLGYKALPEDDLLGPARRPSLCRHPARRRAGLRRRARRSALQLAARFEPLLAADGLDSVYRDLERPLIPVLVAIERAGVRVDATPWPVSRSASSASWPLAARTSSSWLASRSTSTRRSNCRRFSSKSCSCRRWA